MTLRRVPTAIGERTPATCAARARRRQAPLAVMGFVAAMGCATALAESASVPTEGTLLLELDAKPRRAYVHEPVAVSVTLLAADAQLRNLRVPELQVGAGTLSPFSGPRRTTVIRAEREFVAYRFDAKLTAGDAGSIALGPAEIRGDLLVAAGGAAAVYGGNEERTIALRSGKLEIVIAAPPPRGQPAGYAGLVGQFRLSRHATPATPRAGEPVEVTTRIEGAGNLETVECPAFGAAGVRSYPPRPRRTDGVLVCDQLLLPAASGAVELAPVAIAYFDPQRRQYRTLTAPALRIETEELPAVVMAESRASPVGPESTDATAAGDHPMPMSWSRGTAALAIALSPLLLIVALVAAAARRNPMSRIRRAVPPAGPPWRDFVAQAEIARDAGDGASFHTAAYRALQQLLSTRYGVPPGGITIGFVDTVMRRRGATPRACAACARIFAACDQARYAPDQDTNQNLDRLLADLRSSVEPHWRSKSPAD